jgi:hypothetical protein
MKVIAALLIAGLILEGEGLALHAGPKPDSAATQSKQAVKAKSEIQRRGVGEHAKVRVVLRNGSEIRGWVSRTEDESFEVTDHKTGRITAIAYNDVEGVHGPGLSHAAQVTLGIAVVAAAVILIVLAVAYPKT